MKDMKIKVGQLVQSPKGLEYTIVGIEDNKVVVSRINKAGEEFIKEFKKSTITKTFKPAPQESNNETKEASKTKDPIKDTTNKTKAPRKANKGNIEGVISLKNILESLGIEATADYMKTLRRKLRKSEELKSLRVDGYNWGFKVEDKDKIVKKLKDIV